MISEVRPLSAGNALQLSVIPPAGAVSWRIYRKGSADIGAAPPPPPPAPSPSPAPSPAPTPAPAPAPALHEITFPGTPGPSAGLYVMGTGWVYNPATDEIWATTRDSYYDAGFDDSQLLMILDASTGAVKELIPRGAWPALLENDAAVYPNWMKYDAETGAVFFVGDFKSGASTFSQQGLYRINADKTLGWASAPAGMSSGSSQYLTSWLDPFTGDLYLIVGYANNVVNPNPTIGKVDKATGAFSVSYRPVFSGMSASATTGLSPGEFVFTPYRKFVRLEVNGASPAPVQACWGKIYEWLDNEAPQEVVTVPLLAGEVIAEMRYADADGCIYVFCSSFDMTLTGTIASERVFRFDPSDNSVTYVYDQPARCKQQGYSQSMRWADYDKALIPTATYDSYRDVFWLTPFRAEDLSYHVVAIDRATGAVAWDFLRETALIMDPPGTPHYDIPSAGQFGGLIVQPTYIALQDTMYLSDGTDPEYAAYDSRQVYLQFTPLPSAPPALAPAPAPLRMAAMLAPSPAPGPAFDPALDPTGVLPSGDGSLLVYEGFDFTVVDAMPGLVNEQPMFYRAYYLLPDGWMPGPVAQGTPRSTYQERTNDVQQLVRDRLEAGLAVEISRGALKHENGAIAVYTAPPLADQAPLPLVTVHLESDESQTRGIGEFLAQDERPEWAEWGEQEGWLGAVSLEIIGWSLNPDERAELRRAIRRILIANLPVFAAAGMQQITIAQRDVEFLQGEFDANVFQTVGTFNCEAPVLVETSLVGPVNDTDVSAEPFFR